MRVLNNVINLTLTILATYVLCKIVVAVPQSIVLILFLGAGSLLSELGLFDLIDEKFKK